MPELIGGLELLRGNPACDFHNTKKNEDENESDIKMAPIGQTGIGIYKTNTSATGNEEAYD